MTTLKDKDKNDLEIYSMRAYDESLELDLGENQGHFKEGPDSLESGEERH